MCSKDVFNIKKRQKGQRNSMKDIQYTMFIKQMKMDQVNAEVYDKPV